MTIGIAVTGPNAGLAVFRALAGVERVGRGAIGGFASFVCITESGELRRAQTQRGGTSTLFTEAETTGTEPPPEIAQARFAAVMSSGPDRPVPLAQFAPGDPGVGLVSGHRLPNMPGADGIALNLAVLERMRQGASATDAAAGTLAANPDADAGIIALGLDGDLFAGNSALVAARGDLGYALDVDPETDAKVAVLHNAIQPQGSLAKLAADLALDCINPVDRADLFLALAAGCRLAKAAADRLVIDAAHDILRVEVAREMFFAERADGAVIGERTPVVRDNIVIGYTTNEPYATVEDGVIRSLSGGDRALIGVRRTATARNG